MACRSYAYRYDRNGSQIFQTLWNVNVFEKWTKLLFRCSENDKYFKRTILAYYQLFSREYLYEILTYCFVSSVATILQRVETLWLSLKTECEVRLSNLQKRLQKQGPDRSQKQQRPKQWR